MEDGIHDSNSVYKSLYQFSNRDITDMIFQYILNNEKYKKYCTAIAETLINDFLYGNGQRTLDIIAGEEHTTADKKYLETLFGTYMETYMISKMISILKAKTTKSTDIASLIEMIWKFPFDQISDKLCSTNIDTTHEISGTNTHQSEPLSNEEIDNKIDGQWIIGNLDNTNFMDKLREITGMSMIDIEDIYKFILRYNVSLNQQIKQALIDNINLNLGPYIGSNRIDDIIDDNSKIFDINYEELAFKLMNHEDISKLSAKLSALIYNIIIDNKDKEKQTSTNYNIISKFYKVFSSTFSSLFLQNWWCSNCWYHNRICKIGNKTLDPLKDELMLNCIVCGIKKLDSIQQALRNKINHRHLLKDYESVDDTNDCHDSSDIYKCDYAQKLSPFITTYSADKYRNYDEMLSKLDCNDFKLYILSNSIDAISDKNDKNRICKILNIDENESEVSDGYIQIDGNAFTHLNKEDFVRMIMNHNNKISILSIDHLYDNIISKCNDYVQSERIKIFSISYDEIIHCWHHIIQIHLDRDIQNTYTFLTSDITECDDSCSMFVNMKQRGKRDRARPQQTLITTDNDNYNHNTVQYIRNDEYYRNIFDDIHNFIYHSDNEAITKEKTFEITLKNDDDDEDREEPEDNDEHLVFNVIPDDIMRNNDAKEEKKDDDEYNDHQRYMSDVDSYGFGLIYSYELMSPFAGNHYLKDELLNTGYINAEIWNRSLTKAFNKYKLICNTRSYVAKQQSHDYNINKGDALMVPHILCIIFYTGFTAFCTEYRSTFRKIETELSEDLTRLRHSKFYFFSRLLYECIEFYGDVMRNHQIVYHGLNQPFFFQHFMSHFNAPISTTTDWHIANVKFSRDNGIILALKVGNNSNDDRDDIVAEFESYQARYIDVSWISAFRDERELLFFGRSIIFEIAKIYHKEIPNNTLKQLNLLQRIVKNRSIDWNEIKKARVKVLSQRLRNTREINKKWVQYQNEKNEIKQNIEDESNQLQTGKIEYMDPNQFKQFASDTWKEWKLSDNDKKTKLVMAFEDYLTMNNLSAKVYLDVPRKVILNWMKNKLSPHNIKIGDVAKCYNVLQKEIQKNNEEISQIIENKQREATKQFDTPYYLKLYNYFCAAQRSFVCIQTPFQLPTYIKAALFSKNVDIDVLLQEDEITEEEKYKEEDDEETELIINTKMDREINVLSLSKLTNLFSNVEMVIFSHLSFDEMVRYCSQFCEAVIEYVNDYENNKHKRLNVVIFKSMESEDSKYSPNLDQIVKQYQLKSSSITMSYTFDLEITHTFTFKLQEYH